MKQFFRQLSTSAAIVAGSLFCAGMAAADTINVAITVDNSYAIFTGNRNAATAFHGSNFDWGTAENYSFNLARGDYIYVVTASDKSTAQGFLGQFVNQTTGAKFYSNDAAWQVMATGLGSAAPYTGSVADLALLSTEIGDANAGGNQSQGWKAFTAGGSNGSGPWGTIAGIDSQAKWAWYAGGNCSRQNPTLGGCDAGEWLVFRIAAAATVNDPTPGNTVPEPASVALAGLALLAAGAARRRAR